MKIPPRIRCALRLVGWNVLLTIGGLSLMSVAGEVYLRLTRPFAWSVLPSQFVPGVGIIRKPNAEVRYTNGVDFYTVSRTNSLGFLDREPPSHERAAESCLIAIIGDSFVEASEVSIADKLQVRLEELAFRAIPEQDITTSAFGIRATGQINQLPYYDEFVRPLHPDLIVLVFTSNDFSDNAGAAEYHRRRHVTIKRGKNGTLKLRPPNQNYRDPLGLHRRISLWRQVLQLVNSVPFFRPEPNRLVNVIRMRYLRRWLDTKINWTALWSRGSSPDAETIKLRYAATDFALDQFQRRAARDGSVLVILAAHDLGGMRSRNFDRMSALARKHGIPVVDLYDYIIRQGKDPNKDAQWAHDVHWNVAGHRWAAEALLEYLKQNREFYSGKRAS